MKRTLCEFGVAALCFMWTLPGAAQSINDHLKCYRVKDPLKLTGTVDLGTQQFGLDSRCKISEAKYLCLPATMSNAAVTDKTTRTPIALLPVTGPDAGIRLCYEVECPRAGNGDLEITDEFGARTVSALETALVCVPTNGLKCSALHAFECTCTDGTPCTGFEDCNGDPRGECFEQEFACAAFCAMEHDGRGNCLTRSCTECETGLPCQ